MKTRKTDGSDTIAVDDATIGDAVACQEALAETSGENGASDNGADSLLADEPDDELDAVLAGCTSVRADLEMN